MRTFTFVDSRRCRVPRGRVPW